MTFLRLARDTNNSFGWRVLEPDSPEFELEELNGYKVVKCPKYLWDKIKNLKKIESKGFDKPIVLAGKRRTGKSTLGKLIAYLMDPDAGIEQFVAGLDDSFDKIENAKQGSNLVFDESSLSFSSKDAMAKAQKQLLKIMDVIAQKHLTIIFILPDFFDLNRAIAVTHSLFLIMTYTDENLARGRYAYFGQYSKSKLYTLGKKAHNYNVVEADFIDTFPDFLPPYEEEYLRLKKESLRQAINPKKAKENKQASKEEIVKQIMLFQEKCPHILLKDILQGFSVSDNTFYHHRKLIKEAENPRASQYSIISEKKSDTDNIKEDNE